MTAEAVTLTVMLDGVLDDVGHRALDRGAIAGGENRFPFRLERHLVSGRKRHRREVDDDAARDRHEIDFIER